VGAPSVFALEPVTEIPRTSYVLSYPHVLSYFQSRDPLDATDLVRGAHMIYGWMPTVLELFPEPGRIDLDRGAELLTRARCDGSLTDPEIADLVALVNNSLVGTSKLLHFVAPEHFAIWDTRVCRFVFPGLPTASRVTKIGCYRTYLSELERLRGESPFPGFHRSVNAKLGYPVSALRAIELIMFLNTPALTAA
jgi:hypothetical protein